MLVLRAEIVTIFEPKMLTIPARNTNIYKICKLFKIIFSKLYNISQPNFAILLISPCSFQLWCLIPFFLLRLKCSLTCKLSITTLTNSMNSQLKMKGWLFLESFTASNTSPPRLPVERFLRNILNSSGITSYTNQLCNYSTRSLLELKQ